MVGGIKGQTVTPITSTAPTDDDLTHLNDQVIINPDQSVPSNPDENSPMSRENLRLMTEQLLNQSLFNHLVVRHPHNLVQTKHQLIATSLPRPHTSLCLPKIYLLTLLDQSSHQAFQSLRLPPSLPPTLPVCFIRITLLLLLLLFVWCV